MRRKAAVSTDPVEDVGAFAERVLGQALWPHQLKAARGGRFITVVAAARRTGKTTMAETLAIWTAFRERGVKVLVLSATQDAARRVTESIGATLDELPATRGAVVEDFATRIRLTNGSEIISLPASQRQVRGYGRGVKLLVIDEAGFVSEELWRAAHYVALDERRSGSRILLTGTPWGGAEHFFRRAFEARDGEHSSHQWTYRVNPLLDHRYLEAQRERVAPAEYAAEVLGEWSEASGSFFPRALVEACTADVEPLELADLRPRARLLLGCDWGVSFDRSAAVAIGRLPVALWNPDRDNSRAVFIVAGVQVWPVGASLTGVVEEIAASRGDWAMVSPETSGVGAMPSEALFEALRERRRRVEAAGGDPPTLLVNPVATTAPRKAAAYGALRHLMEERRLVLPRHPTLLRQLAGLRFEIGDSGQVKIHAESEAVHDDAADACFLAAGPIVKKPSGRLVVALMNAARGAVPETRLPPAAADVETALTGAGLRVPLVPWLQSVFGGELTAPRVPGDPGDGPPINPAVVAAIEAGARALRDARAGRRAGWGPDDTDHESGDNE